MRITPLILLTILAGGPGCGTENSVSSLSLPLNMPSIVAKSIEFLKPLVPAKPPGTRWWKYAGYEQS